MAPGRWAHKTVAQYKALMPAVQHACKLVSEQLWSVDAPEASIVFDIDDTLIFDDSRQTPNVQVKHLLEVCRAHGCKIHLVTAREKSPDVMRWTRDELRRHGIHYDTLALAPKKARESMASIASWKHAQRSKHKPVLLSVGDQWGDSVLIATDEDIESLNTRHNVSEGPWVLYQVNDGITMFGFKLMA